MSISANAWNQRYIVEDEGPEFPYYHVPCGWCGDPMGSDHMHDPVERDDQWYHAGCWRQAQ